MITVETMHWWHIEAVHGVEQRVFPVDRWSVEQFWAELAQPTRRYVVALENDEVVGYAGVFLLAPEADVQTIAVAPHAQGRGVGGRLMECLIELAATEGCAQMMLEVRADNAPAIAMYERFGFERLSSRTGYYGAASDALIMRLRPVEAP